MRSYKTTRISRTILSAFVLMALIAFSSSSAFAITAANTVIRNSATVNYTDAAGDAQTPVTAFADIFVQLVPSTPTLSAPIDQTVASGTDAIYSYTVTSNANGPDNYTQAMDSLVESAGINGSSVVFSGGTSLDLGASSVAVAITTLAGNPVDIVVPSDTTSDSSVNGIEANDTVIIGGNSFFVNSITDNASGTSSINVTGATATSVLFGDLIREQKSGFMTITPGAISDNSADQTITLNISVGDTAGSSVAAIDETVTTVTVSTLTIVKLVRNQTTNSTGSFTATATGVPANVLRYQLTITSTSGDASSVVVTDTVPDYTTLVVVGGNFAAVDPGTGVYEQISVVNTDENILIASGDATGTDPGDVMTFYLGPGNTSSSGGTIAVGEVYIIEYDITID